MGTTKTKSAKPTSVMASISKGSVLSESSFYVVQDVQPGQIIVTDDFGNQITLGDKYVNNILASADYYEKEEPKTMTELADIFLSNPRVALAVCYITKGKEKTKKDFEAEKAAKTQEILSASLATAPKLLSDLIDNPISKTIPGSERVMKGRHYGKMDDLGRVHFIDMEISRDKSKDYDTRSRQVDPRTIQWLIVNKVKYVLK